LGLENQTSPRRLRLLKLNPDHYELFHAPKLLLLLLLLLLHRKVAKKSISCAEVGSRGCLQTEGKI